MTHRKPKKCLWKIAVPWPTGNRVKCMKCISKVNRGGELSEGPKKVVTREFYILSCVRTLHTCIQSRPCGTLVSSPLTAPSDWFRPHRPGFK